MHRVLSIQSHVVYGYVGNKVATFPLQLHGFDVDAINTVQFSNHTGYPTCLGQKLQGPEMAQLITGLVKNNLLEQYTHVLSGYIGQESCLQQVEETVRLLKQTESGVFYLCDPVLGDAGKLYVSENLIPLYRARICPLADLMTPNHYEAQILSGLDGITSIETARQAVLAIHKLGVPRIVVTSIPVNSSELYLFGSFASLNRNALNDDKESWIVAASYQFYIPFPKIDHHFTGTGDLFSALLLAHLENSLKDPLGSQELEPNDGRVLQTACEKALTATHRILLSVKLPPNHKPTELAKLELPLIQSKNILESSEVDFQSILL